MGNLGHDKGCIVVAAVFPRPGEDPVGQVCGFTVAGQLRCQSTLPETVDETVGAEKKAVIVLEGMRFDLRVNAGVTAPEGVIEGAATWMGAVGELIDFSTVPLSPGPGVISCELGGFLRPVEIETGVAEVGEMQVSGAFCCLEIQVSSVF